MSLGGTGGGMSEKHISVEVEGYGLNGEKGK